MTSKSIKTQLKTELEEVEQKLEKLDAQLHDKPDVGLGTGSTGIDSWELGLARKERMLQQIEDLRNALARVAAGEYGRCTNCGAEIDAERLEILPTTKLCAACAEKQQ